MRILSGIKHIERKQIKKIAGYHSNAIFLCPKFEEVVF